MPFNSGLKRDWTNGHRPPCYTGYAVGNPTSTNINCIYMQEVSSGKEPSSIEVCTIAEEEGVSPPAQWLGSVASLQFHWYHSNTLWWVRLFRISFRTEVVIRVSVSSNVISVIILAPVLSCGANELTGFQISPLQNLVNFF